jgi:REP element-mobilizing transposase RayT
VTIPRSRLVDHSRASAYHLVSRCVRRAFLCGDRAGHRRQWVVDAVRDQSRVFAIDALAYAVMANHLHLVVTIHPERASVWTPLQVAERWVALFPARDGEGDPVPPALSDLQAKAADAAWVAERRRRLSSVSWFMKLLKERIARRANREDHCTGHFWEGRFTSVALLDQAAVTACMAYVDLNPIRARIADRPERCGFTSVQARVERRQAYRKVAALRQRAARPVATPAPAPGPESGLWLSPLRRCVPYADDTARLCPGPLGVDDYLTLVDETGRFIRAGKRGAIPARLAPILARLDLDVEAWLAAMLSPRRFLGGAIGSAAARAAEALRRGVKWVVDKARVHRAETRAA